MTDQTASRAPTPWRVLCPRHGLVFLTHEEYEEQLSVPDRDWCCPAHDEGNPEDPEDVGPGICGSPASWDEAWYDAWVASHADQEITAEIPEMPDGCLSCNPSAREQIQSLLDQHGIKVEAVPSTASSWREVVVCQTCGQAWLMMPRDAVRDPS